jgi:hypothetical protein
MSDSHALTTAPAELRRLEQRIERGLLKLHQIRRAFISVGEALRRIRGKRLYRATHGTWEAYCRSRWRMGRSNIDKLIASAHAIVRLGASVERTLNASQARQLAPFRDRPDLQARIIKRATGAGPGHGLTADRMARAARQVLDELPEVERDELDQPNGRAFLPVNTETRARRVQRILEVAERMRVLMGHLGPQAALALTRLDQLVVAVHQLD